MAQVLPEPLKKAWTAYQSGDLAGAAGLCQDILARHNRNHTQRHPRSNPLPLPPAQMAAKWERLLVAKNRLWIGIIWSDDAPHVKDHSSIELTTFLKLLDVDATLVCAQRDMSGSDAAHLKALAEILTFGNALSDFSEAAGLLSCLDLLISVDSVAGTTIGMGSWHASPSNCKDMWAAGCKRLPRRRDSGFLGQMPHE
jgi:hypothetical protein